MKKIIPIVVFSLIIFSCARKEKKNVSENKISDNRIEITPFIISTVILKDTTQIKTLYAKSDSGKAKMAQAGDYYENEARFLNVQQFNQLKSAVWSLINNPKSKVHLNPYSNVADPKDLKNKVVYCDSVKESSFDEKGVEVIRSMFNCDSSSVVDNINMIKFYESWYFNRETNMMDKEVLGYTIYEYVDYKKAYKDVFSVFKNEESLAKARKWYFY